MTGADDVLRRVDANDIELIRIVFVNNSGVPRGRVVDGETLPGVLDEGANMTRAMQSFNALDRLAPGGRYGPGQQELVVDHEPGVAASDSQILFKETVAGVAADHDVGVTFRPHPFPELPGTGCHVHLSLWRDGENVLHDPADDSHYPLSDRGRQFVGGLLAHAPALVALTAPTVESHERLVPGMWASAYTCWGHDNREAMVRILSVSTADPATYAATDRCSRYRGTGGVYWDWRRGW